MSQDVFSTMNPNTKSGTQLATDLNNFRDALLSAHSGSSAPSYITAGLLWINTSANPWILNIYDGSENIEIGKVDTTTNLFNAYMHTLNEMLDTNGQLVAFSKGANIASASDCDIWANEDGNIVHITGTTSIKDFGTPPRAGSSMFVIFDSTVTVVDDSDSTSSVNVVGGANWTSEAGDPALVVAETVSTFHFIPLVVHPSSLVDIPYDIPFNAGMGADFGGEDLAVQAYGDLDLARDITFVDDLGSIDTGSAGADVLIDVLLNGSTIFSTLPKFTASTTTFTGGVFSTTQASAGDTLTFKITQVGSTTAGQKLRYTIKGKTR